MDDGTGRPKIDAARDAVSLFVQLVKASVGNRLGLVSFSTSASSPADFAIAPLTPARKTTLIGPAPYSAGLVGLLAPGGSTSIGDGLDKGHLQVPAPGTNPRTILLMTDGLQNTYPFIADREGLLTGIDLHAIGFGSASNLDGALLSGLASRHNGVYVRAAGALALEKYFSHAFGNIFETGILMDPEFELAANQAEGTAQQFDVCGEDAVTAVAGWDDIASLAYLEVTSPGGATVTQASPGVQGSRGRTWTFLRIPLPYGGERDGTWTVRVLRPGGRKVTAAALPSLPALRYFINVVPSGGPRLARVADGRRYYTGDPINPLVQLRYDAGGWPQDAKVALTVTRPDTGVGNLLSKETLGPPATLDGDTIPAIQATLMALEKKLGHAAVGYTEQTFALGDDPLNSGGHFEAAGVFGKPILDLLTMEGTYTFHYRATYGDTCTATREVLSSLHVDIGIDPGRTDFHVTEGSPRPDGSREVSVVIVPRDRYGNSLGPGRGDGLDVTGTPGTTLTGPLVDNGDGSYTASGTWNPKVGSDPALIAGQPGRPSVVLHPPSKPSPKHRRRDKDGEEKKGGRLEAAEELLESLDIRGHDVEDVHIRRIVVDIEVREGDDEG